MGSVSILYVIAVDVDFTFARANEPRVGSMRVL